jgi:hypothetical protein
MTTHFGMKPASTNSRTHAEAGEVYPNEDGSGPRGQHRGAAGWHLSVALT